MIMTKKNFYSEYKNFFIFPKWAKKFNDVICGFSLPVLGNQALTRKSISSGRTTYENRLILAKILNIIPDNIFYPHQIHSDIVINVTLNEIGKGLKSLDNAIKADACITTFKNILLVTTWADCIPIIIYDNRKRIISSIHSGWRGTKLNIIKKVLAQFFVKGSDKKDIYVSIGPGIRDCCYNVGNEFKDHFRGTKLDGFLIKKNDNLYFDLAGAVYFQILNEGILKENIDFIDKCTCCSKKPSFFSCRKDGSLFESQAAFIALL